MQEQDQDKTTADKLLDMLLSLDESEAKAIIGQYLR